MVALAVTGVGLVVGATAFAAMSVAGVSLATIGMVASAVSAAASMASQALMKPPDMRGTISQVMIGANMPVPYAMGRTYLGGGLVYDNSANGPDNYDRTQIFVYTAAGPIDSFEGMKTDFTAIAFPVVSSVRLEGAASGFYSGYAWINTRLGLRPDTALTAPSGRAAFSEWGAAYGLSGYAAASITMEFDEDGKRWASGIPQWGMVAKWVKVYDPRLDSTYPGGSGAHRWDDEATWTWSENPGLHALTYARGRFVNGVRVVGPGLDKAAIDIPDFVAFANVCDANTWKVGGAVYEGPGTSKWNNLKTILAAGAAEPAWIGGLLTLKVSAPKTALDTITSDDVVSDIEIKAMGSWKNRHNTIIPRYRSENHRWEYVQAEAVAQSTYVTEDGESKTEEMQWDLVQNVTHAAQLAAYMLGNRREYGPITMTVKPRLMLYKPGEALTLNIPEAGLNNQLAVIIARQVDAATGMITLTFESETTAKHAYALGKTGVAPPSPVLTTPQQADELVADVTVASTISLALSDPGFSYIDGIPADPSQTITITATQNKPGTITWSVSPVVTLGTPTADSRTLTLANFGANIMVTVTATSSAGGVTSITIPRIDYTTPSDSIIADSFVQSDIGSVSSGAPWESDSFTRVTSV